MFNSSPWWTGSFRNGKVLKGTSPWDMSTHKTVFAGPDPADPSRVLIRKLIRVNETTYCFEESRITPGEKNPTVHSQMYRVRGFDLREHLDGREIQIRGAHRPLPNVMGFSLFYKTLENRGKHLSIVENTLTKASGTSWRDWFADLRDRRDMSSYMRRRWAAN